MSRRPGTTQTTRPKPLAPAILDALVETASGQGRDYLGSTIDSMTEQEALHILTSMVRDGSAGSRAPDFVKAILEIRAQAGNAIGPPPPTTDKATYDRLRRIFHLCNQPVLDSAYADHCSERVSEPPPPPDSASESPEIVPEGLETPPVDPETTPTSAGEVA